MKKIVVMICLIALALSSYADGSFVAKEGDIVFQFSHSKQSPLVAYATGSSVTHCGIVVEKGKELYVLEASNVVKLTPFNTWTGRNLLVAFYIVRVFDKSIKIKYSKYLGMPYDYAFKFGNNKMYCSELVYEIYKRQFGVELCKPRKVSSYHTFGLRKVLKRRGISLNQLVVAPSDIADSKRVRPV